MCKNLRPSKRKVAIIFKIVAKKPDDPKYYSIAMGFPYSKRAGKIPVVKVQHRIGYYFDDDILCEDSYGYETKMIGRTAGFVKMCDAEYRANHIAHETDDYEVIVVRAKLTDSLMLGNYADAPIIAGRHIEWLE